VAILLLKGQGFPEVLNKLGVQLPLQGPFWGFDSVVVPTYTIGSSSLQQNCLGLPYNNVDFVEDIALNPLAALLLTSPNLSEGRYAFQLHTAWGNGDTVDSYLLWKIRQLSGAVKRTTALTTMANVVQAMAYGGRVWDFVEDMQEGDSAFSENLTAFTPGSIRSTLRWIRLGDIPRTEQL